MGTDPLITRVITPATAGGLAISTEVRRELLRALRLLATRRLIASDFAVQALEAFRGILERYEPYLARTASESLLAAYLEGGHGVLRRLPPAPSDPLLKLLQSLEGPPDEPPVFTHTAEADEPEPFVTFPMIEEAARDLAARRLMHASDFYAAESAARLEGFTVSRVASIETLGRVKEALTEAVADGSTLPVFRERVEEALEESRLSPAHVETIFRAGVMGSYARGQKALLEQPLVRSALPFIRRVEIRDSRLTSLCKALSAGGIDGTDIFCLDDPLWRTLFAPMSHWNCRCSTIPLTLERAARKLPVARRWLETGERPDDAELFVAPPVYPDGSPVSLPPGWVSSWAA